MGKMPVIHNRLTILAREKYHSLNSRSAGDDIWLVAKYKEQSWLIFRDSNFWEETMRKRLLSLAALCSMAASAASATTLYSEFVSGDLTPSGSPNPMTFNAVLGTNEVLGRWNPTPPTDTDNFNIFIDSTLEVVSVALSYTGLANGEVVNLGLRDSSTNLFDDAFVSNLGQGTTGVTGTLQDTFGAETGPLSLTNTTFEFFTNGGTIFGPAFGYPNIDWTATLVTRSASVTPPPSPVPLPAGLPLLLAGLGAFGFVAKRKSKS